MDRNIITAKMEQRKQAGRKSTVKNITSEMKMTGQ